MPPNFVLKNVPGSLLITMWSGGAGCPLGMTTSLTLGHFYFGSWTYCFADYNLLLAFCFILCPSRRVPPPFSSSVCENVRWCVSVAIVAAVSFTAHFYSCLRHFRSSLVSTVLKSDAKNWFSEKFLFSKTLIQSLISKFLFKISIQKFDSTIRFKIWLKNFNFQHYWWFVLYRVNTVSWLNGAL